jgi:hypothetical protein
VVNKRDLFCALDLFMMILDAQYDKRPAAALLLGGSLKHLVFLLFMSILHTKGDDIGGLYTNGASQIKRFMAEALVEYESKKANDKVLSLIKGVARA